MVFAHYASEYMKDFQKPPMALDTKFDPKGFATGSSVNAFFRNIYVTLSYSEIQKEIKKQKKN